MTNKDLTEHEINSEVVYSGRLLHVRRDEVRLPDGNTSVREYITHPGAVVIIPIADNGELILERQHRYPLHRDFIELPAGKIDAGEQPAAAPTKRLAGGSRKNIISTPHSTAPSCPGGAMSSRR